MQCRKYWYQVRSRGAAKLAEYLVAATTCVEDVRHADIEKDDLRHMIVEQAGG